MKIKRIEKLLANFYNKKEHYIHIRNLKQTSNYELILTKLDRTIKFNQGAWLNQYIDVETELRKMNKMILKIIFQILMNNEIFRKVMKNVRKH